MASTAKRPKHQCEKCQQIFDRQERLEKHQIIEHNCNHCSKKFCKLKNLQRHNLEEHNKKSKKCGVCLKVFKSLHDFKIHQQNTKECECNHCSKKYCQLKDLQRHQLEEHNIDCKKCVVCLKVFGSVTALEYHKANSEQHDCDLCERKLCNEKDYVVHQTVDHHVNPRIYKVCNKKF